MKSIHLEGIVNSRLVNVPKPSAFAHFAVVRIHSAPLCTEYKSYFNNSTCSCVGHEAAGEVVEALPGSRVKRGDRVVVMPQYPCGSCDHCEAGEYIFCESVQTAEDFPALTNSAATFAEYILKPDWLLLKIPTELTYDEAAMACCGLGPAFQAVKKLQVQQNDSVLITGLGPVGLGSVITATARNASVIGASANAYRRQLALDLGASEVIDTSSPDALSQIRFAAANNGITHAIECSGWNSYQHLALNAINRRGQVAFIGECSSLTIDLSSQILRNGLTLYGIWHWNLHDQSEMFKLIQLSRSKIHKLITHSFPMTEFRQAFELQATGNCGKVILKP